MVPPEPLFGRSSRFSIRLPNRTTRMPASVNRIPANSICDAVSPDPMENSLYPILTQGKALPQRKQLIKVPASTTGSLLQKRRFF